jgi:hypothetical protein
MGQKRRASASRRTRQFAPRRFPSKPHSDTYGHLSEVLIFSGGGLNAYGRSLSDAAEIDPWDARG